MKGKKTGGKVKGSKNLKSIQWEELGHSLLTNHSGRANQILATCDDEMFLDNYTKLMEYFKPKLARTEVTGKDGEKFLPENTTITFK